MGNTFCVFVGCIDQASVGVVEKWGRFDKLAQPGLNFFNPLAGEWLAGVMSTRISSLDVRIETKTKVICISCSWVVNFPFYFLLFRSFILIRKFVSVLLVCCICMIDWLEVCFGLEGL